MLLGMLEDPNDFIDHLRRYTASLTTQMTFGFRTTSIQDPNFKEAFEVNNIFGGECALTNVDIRCDIRAGGYKGKPETLHTLEPQH